MTRRIRAGSWHKGLECPTCGGAIYEGQPVVDVDWALIHEECYAATAARLRIPNEKP